MLQQGFFLLLLARHVHSRIRAETIYLPDTTLPAETLSRPTPMMWLKTITCCTREPPAAEPVLTVALCEAGIGCGTLRPRKNV